VGERRHVLLAGEAAVILFRARAFAIAVVTLVLALALHAGACDALPGGLRVALALLVLVLAPGAALLELVGATPPGGRALAAGWALGLGIAWNALLVLATIPLRMPFTVLAPAAAVPAALLWIVLSRRRPSEEETETVRREALPPAALAAIALAAALAVVVAVRLPTPVTYYSDSPDHIGTIRRMMATGDAFPRDAFFRDAGREGVDPRKGLWHPVVALVALEARVDPLPAWRALAAVLAALFVVNAAILGAVVAGAAGAAVAAWALLLTYGGSLASQYLREAVFATKLADQLATATIAAVLADLERRTRGSRTAAIGVGLGAVATHVFAALQFGLVFGALGVGLFVRGAASRPHLRRMLATVLVLAAACLPYLLWRAHGSYAPTNVIHTEPQGLLTLWDGVRVVSPGVLWDWTGLLWLLFPFAWWAWARDAGRPASMWLLTTSLAVAAILFLPPLVRLLQPRLGYLLMRFVWVLPVPAALAWVLPRLARAAARGGRAAIVGLALVLALLAPALADGFTAFARPDEIGARENLATVERWSGALAWMDAHLPAGSVVLSDPATSYSIPMMTRHWVATLVDQHSSPNDSHALERILDARDALDPYSEWSHTREVVRRRGVTAIALNDRFVEIPRLDYWSPSPSWYRAARARFDAAPSAFRRVYDTGDFVVYAINPTGLDSLTGGGRSRPYVATLPTRSPLTVAGSGDGMPQLLGARLERGSAHDGDSLTMALDWCSPRPLTAGAYEVAVRFDRALPAGLAAPAWCAKPFRKLVERARGQRYRFRVDHLPVEGDYGVDRWAADELVHDSTRFRVPPDAAPGTYAIQVRMLRQPHYPNFRLSDYFFDRDYYSGATVGTLVVTPAPGR
jgi:hypothetical protein